MAIPPVSMLSNQPGGGIVSAMNAINSLASNNLVRKKKLIENQYLPDTLKANNMSKLAYANLMGPQFMAKLLANDTALAGMGDAQAKEALQSVVNAARGNGGNALNQMPTPQNYSGVGQPGTNSISGHLWNSLKSMFGQGNQQSHQGNNNSFANPMPNQRTAPQGQGDNPYANPNEQENPNANYQRVSDAYSAWKASPEGQKAAKILGDNYMPEEKDLLNWYDKQQGRPSTTMDMTGGKRDKSLAEKTGEFQGVKAEGKKEGEIRATQRAELDDQYQQAVQAEVPMEHLNEIVTNPMFRKLRRDGLFQKLQLDAKEITGTPEEKQLIGDFQTTALKALSESIMGWKGRILDKEVGISNSMKVGPKDSIDSMLGKMPSIETFNEMTKQRARLASQIMRDQHISKGDALEIADRQVNGKAIREKINKQLNSKAPAKMKRPDFSKMSDEELQTYIGE